MSSTAVAILVRWHPQHTLWGLMRLPLAVIRPPQRIGSKQGLVFQKFLGCGHNGGFQLKPSLDHQAWFGLFNSRSKADTFVSQSPMIQSYRARSLDCLVLTLQAYQSRGSWSGFSIDPAPDQPASGPIVSLTRASIRPAKAADFWRQSPAAEADLEQAQGCELAIGLGEMPFFRQATLSVWQQESCLIQYAQTGAHRRAIAAAYGRHFFSESMFTRFQLLRAQGQWKGRLYD